MPPIPDVSYAPVAEPRSPHLAATREIDLSPDNLQYFSRINFHRPPSAAPLLTKAPDMDEAVIDGAVEQWVKLLAGQPIEANATFAASPHSTYHGYEVLPNGQIVDHYTAWNVFRVHRNPETNLPYTSTGHESIRKLRAPADPRQAWPLEAPYPTNARLREEMIKMTPLDPPPPGQSGFPVHATFIPPPLEQLSEKLQAYRVKKTAHQLVPEINVLAVRPRDTILPTISPGHEHLHTFTPCPKKQRDEHGSVSEPVKDDEDPPELILSQTEAQKLDKDIEKRVTKDLTFVNDGSPVGQLLSSDEDNDLPELISASSDSEDESLSICVACLGEPHETLSDCPLWGRAETDAASDSGESNESEHTIPYLVNRQMIVDALADATRSAELKRVLNVALAPPLNELLSMEGPRAVAYIRLADSAIEARRAMARLLQEEDEGAREVAKTLINDDELPPEPASSSELSLTPVGGSDSPPLDEHPFLTLNIDSPLTSAVDSLSPSVSPLNSPRNDSDTNEARSTTYCDGQSHINWSNSPEPAPTATSSEEDLAHFTLKLDTSSIAVQLNTSSFVNETPAVTEWSVWSEDFDIDPRLILDDAVNRASAQVPERIVADDGEPYQDIAEYTVRNELASDSAGATGASDQRRAETGLNFDYQQPEGSFATQQLGLRIWHRNGVSHQDQHNFYEDEVIGRPLRDALAVLYGPLREFLDFPSMAAQGVRDLQLLSTIPLDTPTHSVYPEDGAAPDLTQSATSLDYSLPTPPPEPVADEYREVDGIDSPSSELGRKRKMPDGERRGEFQGGMRKKLPTGLADPEIIKQFAGARLAVLEGLSWIEGIIWHRYDVPEHHFPSEYVQHPLLFDFEAAKVHVVWGVLQQRNRHVLAGYLQDFLAIRLRDQYAVSQLLNAGCLHAAYPANSTRYWDLIPAEDFVGSEYDSSFDPSDSDSDYGEFVYPDEDEQAPSVSEGRDTCDPDASPYFLKMDRDGGHDDRKRDADSSSTGSAAHSDRIGSWVEANRQISAADF
ncbi:hypothetical protein C8R44DRAFT_896348 [Mycena epipterygia]|nr:hypothetical protein C8R44DRAFT_896348 [Mycena epipterygia]